MRRKNPFKTIGVTLEGSEIIGGILKFEETYGLPLEMIFEFLKERDLTPGWFDILDDAKRQGVNRPKFLTKLETCIVSVYGKEYWDKIQTYLVGYMNK